MATSTTLINRAALTGYGWIYNWDTTHTHNGTYTLNSVATGPGGNVARSTNVSITISN